MNYQERLAEAVQHFWAIRARQYQRQGAQTGKKDAGYRSAVTGGKHLDGFISLFADLVTEAGLPTSSIHIKKTTLPGYFRPTKNWDIVIVDRGMLLASIEFKAHVGPSFGNNFNNRIEEALGNAVDILAAYREGKFQPSARPWLGWFMLLEESPKSTSPIKINEPHFEVFEEFKDSSYAGRYEIFCQRLIRERLYDGACLILSERETGLQGVFREPNPEIGFLAFATSLLAHITAYVKMNR
jgi:hypothetical protein